MTLKIDLNHPTIPMVLITAYALRNWQSIYNGQLLWESPPDMEIEPWQTASDPELELYLNVLWFYGLLTWGAAIFVSPVVGLYILGLVPLEACLLLVMYLFLNGIRFLERSAKKMMDVWYK